MKASSVATSDVIFCPRLTSLNEMSVGGARRGTETPVTTSLQLDSLSLKHILPIFHINGGKENAFCSFFLFFFSSRKIFFRTLKASSAVFFLLH